VSVKLVWHGDEILKRLDKAQQDGINVTTAKAALHSQRLANRSNGSGRTYRKGTSQATYQASSPGEPPAKPTGLLQGKIRSGMPQRRGNRWVGEWGVNAGEGEGGGGEDDKGYAFWLEIGTARMAARPYLRPSAEQEYPKLAGRIRAFFAKGGTP
jgi:hypothetical protein